MSRFFNSSKLNRKKSNSEHPQSVPGSLTNVYCTPQKRPNSKHKTIYVKNEQTGNLEPLASPVRILPTHAQQKSQMFHQSMMNSQAPAAMTYNEYYLNHHGLTQITQKPPTPKVNAEGHATSTSQPNISIGASQPKPNQESSQKLKYPIPQSYLRKQNKEAPKKIEDGHKRDSEELSTRSSKRLKMMQAEMQNGTLHQQSQQS